jgi:hypothetical protein
MQFNFRRWKYIYFEYDVCGDQTKENQERQFQWDYADRMKLYYHQVNPGQEPSTYAHYLYNSGGNCEKKLTRVSGGDWGCLNLSEVGIPSNPLLSTVECPHQPFNRTVQVQSFAVFVSHRYLHNLKLIVTI